VKIRYSDREMKSDYDYTDCKDCSRWEGCDHRYKIMYHWTGIDCFYPESKLIRKKDFMNRTIAKVETIKIMRIVFSSGVGTKEDPHRTITQYWSAEDHSRLLAEHDPGRDGDGPGRALEH